MKKLSFIYSILTMLPININDIHNITGIEFGVLSANDIRKMSVCKLTNTKYSGPGSVYDEKMGRDADLADKCVTCGYGKECWGHMGHIELNEPLIHPLYYRYVAIFLKCFCKKCHRLLIKQENIEFANITNNTKKIFEKLENVDICCHCFSPQPKINFRVKDKIISMEYKQKNGIKTSLILSVHDIKKIFDDIPDEDVRLLGLNPILIHPRNLIMTVMPVVPPCTRPYIKSGGNVCDDDLTYQLIEIIKINNNLEQKGEPLSQTKHEKLVQSLKFRCGTMMSNTGQAKHPTDSRPLMGFKQRITGKDGLIRGNIMGKRTDFSGRSVIGADPNLNLNQVGIPQEFANIHSKPEIVNRYNIDYLTELVNNGGANSLLTTKIKDGQEQQIRINISHAIARRNFQFYTGDIIILDDKEMEKIGESYDYKSHEHYIVKDPSKIGKDSKTKKYISVSKTNIDLGSDESSNQSELIGKRVLRDGQIITAVVPPKKKIELKFGDIVDRKLRDGDMVIFNRQPTLHSGSMLGMQVKILPNKTLRFGLAATKSFNADFDGDEMNIHVLQSSKADAEAKYITATQENITTHQEGKNIIVIKQDSLIALYIATKENTPLTREQFMNIILKASKTDGSSVWTDKRVNTIKTVLTKFGKLDNFFNGRGLLSFLLPEDFNYENKNNLHPTEHTVKIHRGVYIEGTLGKTILESEHNSLIQIINKEYGSTITANLIDNLQFVANAFLLYRGFSVGLEDCLVTSQSNTTLIRDTLAQYYTKARGIEQTTINPGIREARVTAALSQAKDLGMKIAKDAMRQDNNFKTTVLSGAKGDFFNIAQLTSMLGQQNIAYGRVKNTLNNGTRSLPHYHHSNLDTEEDFQSKGFIPHSFIEGLTPEEFFFHAMSGRESVSDTALGTASSGYTQRKTVKLNEDKVVKNDGTVRDQMNNVFSLSYGSCGFAANKTFARGGKHIFCDVGRLMDRINMCHEEEIELNDSDDIKIPEFTVEVIKKFDKDKDIIEIKEEETVKDENEDENEDEEDEEENENEDEEDDEEDEDILEYEEPDEGDIEIDLDIAENDFF